LSIIQVILIGAALSMDALAVSITNGITAKKLSFLFAFKLALCFALFQGIMPLIGFFAGISFKSLIERVDHFIAFGLLVYIGVKMIIEAAKNKDVQSEEPSQGLTLKRLIVLAVATSIDALAVGVTFSLMVPVKEIFIDALIISACTFVICFAGVYAGKKAGGFFKQGAEIFGGVILIAIGTKILIEHLFF